MRYLSVCSGIEAATQAWHPLGWKPVAFSEIEPFPCAVLAHHYPHVPNWGDMTKFEEWPDEPIDLLCGGTPCQSFSVAGLRQGLADPRGNLMLTYLAIAARYRPRWLVWENVPGVLSSNGGRDFGTFLGALGQLGYGFAYRVLDAQHVRTRRFPFAVPQRRRRVWVVGYLGDWRRAAAVLFDRESLSGHPAPRREAGETIARASDVSADGCCSVDGCSRKSVKRGWCETHYQRWRTTGDVGTAEIKSPNQDVISRFWSKVERGAGCWEWQAARNEKGYGIFSHAKKTLRAHRFAYEAAHGEIADGLHVDHLCRNPACCNPAHLEAVSPQENTARGDAGKHWAIKRGEATELAQPIAPTIHSRSLGGGGHGGGHAAVAFDLNQITSKTNRSRPDPAVHHTLPASACPPHLATPWAVRRLTPRECERLMGYPDDFTAIPWRKKPANQCPDGPRYKALGNSWAVNVADWVGERIATVDAMAPIMEAAE